MGFIDIIILASTIGIGIYSIIKMRRRMKKESEIRDRMMRRHPIHIKHVNT
jgi:hypothetical protein